MIQFKKLWRCHVCLDIHFGLRPPEVCPTCLAQNAFVLIDNKEALAIIDGFGGVLASPGSVIESWKQFSDSSDEFRLVDDEEMVQGLAEGVCENSRNHGLKYCPCRMTTGDSDADCRLICPCNFKIQQRYKNDGECWCGLYVKRVKP